MPARSSRGHRRAVRVAAPARRAASTTDSAPGGATPGRRAARRAGPTRSPARDSGGRRTLGPSSSLLDELDQRPEARLGVHERNRGAARAGPRCVVEHLAAERLDGVERDPAVVDAVTDVVDAFAALLQ